MFVPRLLTMLLALTVAAIAPTGATAAESLDGKYVAGLRDRQLFLLAERYCRDRLANSQISDDLRGELVVELIRTYSLHASMSLSPERERLFDEARGVAQVFFRDWPSHPQALLIKLQAALIPLSQGEVGSEDLEAGPRTPQVAEPVQPYLREAAQRLEELDKELAREIPIRRRQQPPPGALSAEQLVSLQRMSRLELARAFRLQATIAATEQDKLSLLVRASEVLQELLGQLPLDDASRPSVQLDLAQCLRLMGKHDEASALVAGLDPASLSLPLRWKARAELLCLAVDGRDMAAVRTLLSQTREIDWQSNAEFDLMRLEAMLWLGGRVRDGEPELGAPLDDQAADTAELIESTHGPYWSHRASRIIMARVPNGGSMSSRLLERAADGLFLAGDLERALAAYDKAARRARAEAKSADGFRLAFKGALVEQKRERHTEAADRFIAISAANHPQAAQAHLMAVWHQAQLAKNNAAARKQYEAMLREHVKRWSADPTASEARLWLGRLRESDRSWLEAIDAYANLPAESHHFSAAVAAMARCWKAHLREIGAQNQSTGPVAEQATRQLQRIAFGGEELPPAPWPEHFQMAALAAAEITLEYAPEKARDAEALLTAALERSPDASPTWRASAEAIRTLASTLQMANATEAREALAKQLENGDVDPMAVIRALSAATKRSAAAQRSKLAALQLIAIEHVLARLQLAEEDRNSLMLLRGEALLAAGRREEALDAYAQLAIQNPEHLPTQETYARLLLGDADAVSIQRALKQWRMVASRHEPGSLRWQQAKYSVAQCHYRAGNPAAAVPILRYLLEMPPGVTDIQLKDACDELLRKCER